MRKFLIGLGAITLVVIVAVAVGIGWTAYKGSQLDRESKAFLDRALPEIITSQNSQSLLDLATPDLKEKAKPEVLHAMFDAIAQLGPMVEYQGAKGNSLMSYNATSGSTGKSESMISAKYVASARFKNGTATFDIVLLKLDDRWLFNGFHINTAPVNKADKGA